MRIVVRELDVSYQGPSGQLHALRNVNLQVADEFVVVVGGSGSGKSTLLRAVAGLVPSSAGKVAIEGVSQPTFGVVFQDYSLLPWLTARENIEFGARLLGRFGDAGALSPERLLVRVGLEEFGDFLPRELSGGMRQRAALARALATAPDVLLMDEPLSALDAVTREDIQELVDALYTEVRIPTLFVTHDVDEAVFLADRVLVMSRTRRTIVDEIEIDAFSRPRSLLIKESGAFARLRHRVFETLRKEEGAGGPALRYGE